MEDVSLEKRKWLWRYAIGAVFIIIQLMSLPTMDFTRSEINFWFNLSELIGNWFNLIEGVLLIASGLLIKYNKRKIGNVVFALAILLAVFIGTAMMVFWFN